MQPPTKKAQRDFNLKDERKPLDFDGDEYPVMDYASIVEAFFEGQREREHAEVK